MGVIPRAEDVLDVAGRAMNSIAARATYTTWYVPQSTILQRRDVQRIELISESTVGIAMVDPIGVAHPLGPDTDAGS